jgi:signal transduction histidine kinase/putative methionine-R-sulfoxide reductase with GAF domain
MSQELKIGKIDSISSALKEVQPLLRNITQAGSIQELSASVLAVLKKNFDFTSTGFYFLNPTSGELELVEAEGLTEAEKFEAQTSAIHRHPGWVIKNKKTYHVNDESALQSFQRRLNLVSRLYCPVIFKDECIGTIGVASNEPNAFNDNHVAFIEFLCQISAVAYENINHMLELEKSKERMHQAIDALKFGIWDWDLEMNRLYWDDYMYDLYEVNKSEFTGAFEAFEQTLHPDDSERVKHELSLYFERKTGQFESEFRVMTRSGKTKRIAAKANGITGAQGRIIRLVGANWDVSEARETELRLLQASKMSSLGEMSSGIAHEINNPLAIIQGKSNQIRRILSTHPENSAHILKLTEDIDHTVGRISKIVRGLQSFSRDATKDPFELKSLKTIIEDTLSFCAIRFKHHDIELKVGPVRDDLTLECRSPQISQVILNLLQNAFDAVEVLNEKWVSITVKETHETVQILITDSGHGIPNAIKEKILEPFFTTKDVGKGTGLGLSISSGIIKSHHGSLQIENKSKNTCFVIELPKVQKPEIKSSPVTRS